MPSRRGARIIVLVHEGQNRSRTGNRAKRRYVASRTERALRNPVEHGEHALHLPKPGARESHSPRADIPPNGAFCAPIWAPSGIPVADRACRSASVGAETLVNVLGGSIRPTLGSVADWIGRNWAFGLPTMAPCYGRSGGVRRFHDPTTSMAESSSR